MHVPVKLPKARALEVDIAFRFDRFLQMTTILGATNDTERAALIDMDPKTVRRARDKGIIGHEFMGKTVVGLRRHSKRLAPHGITVSLDVLFEVKEKRATRKPAELVAA